MVVANDGAQVSEGVNQGYVYAVLGTTDAEDPAFGCLARVLASDLFSAWASAS